MFEAFTLFLMRNTSGSHEYWTRRLVLCDMHSSLLTYPSQMLTRYQLAFLDLSVRRLDNALLPTERATHPCSVHVGRRGIGTGVEEGHDGS